ncbi:hypothetical protein [Streptomyces griseoviridis]|uniref:hypothetical protein n=1 Tax=Streptomyces griseoviridis TaxID=45398 RepID=UPI003435D03F
MEFAMPKWIITAAMIDATPPTLRTIEIFEGNESEALAKLRDIVSSYARDVTKVTRREVYKYSELQYLVRILGRMKQVEYIMQLAELVVDTDDSSLPNSLE